MTGLVAGVDCSTQATKVVVVDAASGRAVASGRCANKVLRRGPSSETDPHDWWDALRDAIAATGCGPSIGAVSIAAQQLGLVTLDGAHRPLRPAVLWDDTRSAHAAERLQEALGGPAAWAELVGTQPMAGLTVASWAWLRQAEPETAAATQHIRLPHDYLTERLTGQAVTDRGDASGTGWWSGRRETYVDEVLALSEVALDERLLPRVLAHDAPAGQVRRAAAQDLGLRPGIPVGCGTGDNMAAALALAMDPGVPVISLGTSGTAYVRSARAAADPSGQVFADASASGDQLPLTCTLNATLAVDNIARLLGLARDDVAARTGTVVMPFLSGERLPNFPHARGGILGIDHETTPQEVLLAAYEGVAYSLVQSLEALHRHSSGVDPAAPIILVGGGSKGAIWQQTIARLSGRPLVVPEAEELVAWGAAAQAAAAISGEAPIDVARRWNVSAGRMVDRLPIDADAIARIARVRDAAVEVNRRELFSDTLEADLRSAS
jgi:xylulokinase